MCTVNIADVLAAYNESKQFEEDSAFLDCDYESIGQEICKTWSDLV